MKPMIRLAVVCAAVFVLAVLLPARAHAGFIYFGGMGTGKIQRSDLDGSGVTDIVTGDPWIDPRGIALDLGNSHIYWTDWQKIQRSDLDGSGVTDIVTGLDDPSGIALDLSNSHIYW
ncbi:MAG: hypothetical protein GY903_28265, partial [Fuerstiella sp.]|nr:hypothetical protein [Fuerstiella sp.]